MVWLKNDIIRLRALEPKDLDVLYEWENDSSLWRDGCTLSPFSRYVLSKYIAETQQDIYSEHQLRLLICDTKHNIPIGAVDLYDFDPHNRRAGIGIMISTAYQRQGFGIHALKLIQQYAFFFLHINQLYAFISIRNTKSISLFEKCNFMESGHLKNWLMTEQGYTDALLFQCLNEKQSDASLG
ncbi:MAG: GNAT family N-acetyltransferase [Massilibacteroides sp.]|nr:GNAT family N-acetyltransferase [Massilibacteroides sp.]